MTRNEGKDMYKIEILEKKRLEKGLSYTEIAHELGIHKVTVSRTLKGVTLKPRTVKLLADYLGVEMERIVQSLVRLLIVDIHESDDEG
jgi:transcriptional regulator with XRE-family HTH domain